MGINIDCQGKTILDIKNIVFEVLHGRVLLIIEREKIKLSYDLEKLLEKTDQNIYGAGGIGLIDIVDYLKTQKDAVFFSQLVKQAIEEEQKSEYPYRQDIYEYLLIFYHELLKYAKTLKE